MAEGSHNTLETDELKEKFSGLETNLKTKICCDSDNKLIHIIYIYTYNIYTYIYIYIYIYIYYICIIYIFFSGENVCKSC